MSHLKNIYFDNYRVFNKQQKISLQPINFLIGPNSSGKSSIFKSLLLLKSNVTSDLKILDFSSTNHNLGSFDNTINNNSNNKDLTFGFEATISDDANLDKIPFTTKRSIYNVLIEDSEKGTPIKLFLTYSKNDTSGKLKKIEIFSDNEDISFFKLEIGRIEDDFHRLYFNHNFISKNKILNNIFIKDVIRDKYNLNKSEQYHYKTSVNLTLHENKISQYYDEPLSIFSKLYDKFIENTITLVVNKQVHSFLKSMPLRKILKDFSSIIEYTEYIEAVRANTKRLYTNDSQGTSFNELILEYKSREISQESLNFTNKWLQKFDIADEIVFENIEGVAHTIYLSKGNERIALADLGYGITQFLPILMKISLEEPNSNEKRFFNILKKTILLEEPETNLHPRLQSLLADFIVDAINTFEIRFIIETHSEYIIRKLQLLTAEKIISANDINIYYFGKNETSETEITNIKILENGTLSHDFGEGFYDEASELKFKLLKFKSLKL